MPPLTSIIEWIPLEEEEPDDETTVLLLHLEVDIGYHDGDDWFSAITGHVLETPTHWAHLPPHPDED